jgi:Na+/H+-dicarboxylate symporter
MLIAGGLFGYFFSGLTEYTNWIGEIFLRALNMIIVPLIFCSITTGVAIVGSSGNLGRLGAKTIGYYMLSSLAAIFTGLIFVNMIKPGIGADIGLIEPVEGIAASSIISARH